MALLPLGCPGCAGLGAALSPPHQLYPSSGSPSPAVPALQTAGSRDSGRAGAGPSRHWWQCQGHGNGRSRLWASCVPWAVLASEVWPGVGGHYTSSLGSPLPWPGGPQKPAAPAAPSWERGSSCPGPAATAPLLFIYIPEKEPATTVASSSHGPWPRSWALSLCLQPCGSVWSPPRQRHRQCDSGWRSWPRALGTGAARQVPLMPRVSSTQPCPAAQPYLQWLPPPRHYF